MGITEILTIIFVVMKVLGMIDWSWWLVLLPEIIAAALYVWMFISCCVVAGRSEQEINRIVKDMHEEEGHGKSL